MVTGWVGSPVRLSVVCTQLLPKDFVSARRCQKGAWSLRSTSQLYLLNLNGHLMKGKCDIHKLITFKSLDVTVNGGDISLNGVKEDCSCNISRENNDKQKHHWLFAVTCCCWGTPAANGTVGRVDAACWLAGIDTRGMPVGGGLPLWPWYRAWVPCWYCTGDGPPGGEGEGRSHENKTTGLTYSK